MKALIHLLCCLFAAEQVFSTGLPKAPSVEEALARAGERTVLLEFTGKEWCPPCIHLRTHILETPEIEQKAGKDYLLVEIVFPRLPEAVAALPPELREQNEHLLEHYRISTGLPTMLMLDAAGRPFHQIVGTRRSVPEYLAELEKGHTLRRKLEAALAAAPKTPGMERARALAAALELLPPHFRDKYPDIVNEINQVDSQNTLGYARTLTAHREYTEHRARLRELLAGMRGQLSRPQLEAQLLTLRDFLQTPHLHPELQQECLRAMADSYALLRRYKDMYEYTRAAYEAAPHSRLAPRLLNAIQYYEKQLLPSLEQKAKDSPK